MKKFILIILYFIILLDITDKLVLNDSLFNYVKKYMISTNYKLVFNSNKLENENTYKEYTTNVKKTSNFNIKNKDEILDVYYTVLNNGLNDFSFYCDYDFNDCVNDITYLSNDSNTFSYLNSLIHPYNSFKSINSSIKNNNRVDVIINKKYSNEDIDKIENKITEIINSLNVNNYDNVIDKIKVFHDYIVNTNKYDQYKETNSSSYHSDSAIGTLYEGYSICSGYTDAMAIFLNKLGIDNVRIVTQNHTWNAVKINDTWYHIDITWDDPVNNLNKDILSHDYFMLTTNELLSKDLTEHNFDRNLYDFIN